MPENFEVYFSDNFKKVLKKIAKKDKQSILRIEAEVLKLSKEPLLGKPLRNILKNRRRVHIGHFVLVYEIVENAVRFLDYEHHDKVYKKKF